jgi:hypothetical protein
MGVNCNINAWHLACTGCAQTQNSTMILCSPLLGQGYAHPMFVMCILTSEYTTFVYLPITGSRLNGLKLYLIQKTIFRAKMFTLYETNLCNVL